MYLVVQKNIGGSCQKYNFCHEKIMFVATNICCDKSFVMTKIFCHDKQFCRNKSFVATSILLSQQKTCFVATKDTWQLLPVTEK